MELSSLLLYSGIAVIAIAYPAFLLVNYLVKGNLSEGPSVETNGGDATSATNKENDGNNKNNVINNSSNPPTCSPVDSDSEQRKKAKSLRNNDSRGWQCACEGGGIFLPQSLMKSIGGPVAAFGLGAGGCYHKQM